MYLLVYDVTSLNNQECGSGFMICLVIGDVRESGLELNSDLALTGLRVTCGPILEEGFPINEALVASDTGWMSVRFSCINHVQQKLTSFSTVGTFK